MTNAWDIQVYLSVIGNGVPRHVEGVTDPSAALNLVDRAKGAAGGEPFLVCVVNHDGIGWTMLYGCPWGWSLMIQDWFGPGGDVFTTRGSEARGGTWDFSGLYGQELEWPRRYFTAPELVRGALAAYLRTRKLWRGVDWEPPLDTGLQMGESVAGAGADAEPLSWPPDLSKNEKTETA